jgi:hypothetical protein
MPDDQEPGRPAVEAAFAAWTLTTIGGLIVVHLLGRWLPPPPSPGDALPAAALTLAVLYVSTAAAVAEALLPGPRSTGGLGLLIPLTAAVALAVRGLSPSAVVAALFGGVVLTPASYFLAIRLTFPLRGRLRRHPVSTVLAGALAAVAVFEAARWLTWLADPATRGRFWQG